MSSSPKYCWNMQVFEFASLLFILCISSSVQNKICEERESKRWFYKNMKEHGLSGLKVYLNEPTGLIIPKFKN